MMGALRPYRYPRYALSSSVACPCTTFRRRISATSRQCCSLASYSACLISEELPLRRGTSSPGDADSTEAAAAAGVCEAPKVEDGSAVLAVLLDPPPPPHEVGGAGAGDCWASWDEVRVGLQNVSLMSPRKLPRAAASPEPRGWSISRRADAAGSVCPHRGRCCCPRGRAPCRLSG